MRPCTVSDRLCILPNVVTAQRPERPQIKKSEATVFAREFGGAISDTVLGILPRTSEACLPPRGQGGATQIKAEQLLAMSFRISEVLENADVDKGDRNQGKAIELKFRMGDRN